MPELARTFRDLRVYKMAREATHCPFEISGRFPREEKYSLTDQIRRSSRATKNLIPEAWARRRYPAAFVSKLTESLGEAMETQAWLDDALDARYITPIEHKELDAKFQAIGGMLSTMIKGAEDFVPPTIRAKRRGEA